MAAPIDDVALDTLFRTARSYNGYTADPVSEADIRAIYDLAKFGPTATNLQPARFVWCLTPDARDRLAGSAYGSNAEKIRKAPAAVVVGYDVDFHRFLPQFFPHNPVQPHLDDRERRKVHSFRNGSLQAAYLFLAARALGFDVGPMSGFDPDKVEAAFFADQPNVRVNLIATLGHGDPASVFDRLPRPAFEQFNRID